MALTAPVEDPAVTVEQALDVEDASLVTELVTEDLLVEDVSIDGMCGVY